MLYMHHLPTSSQQLYNPYFTEEEAYCPDNYVCVFLTGMHIVDLFLFLFIFILDFLSLMGITIFLLSHQELKTVGLSYQTGVPQSSYCLIQYQVELAGQE